jgi:hypothetical protein
LRSLLRPAAIGILIAAAAGAGSAHAQVTLRIEPASTVFPIFDLRREATIEIFADNVPAQGLGSFEIILDMFNEAGFSPCVRYLSRQLDPALKSAWGGGSSDSVSTASTSTVVTWRAAGFFGFPGPSGTVRIGSMTLSAQPPSGSCFVGKQDSFVWDTASTYGLGITTSTAFASLRGGTWVLGRTIEVDLTLSCTQTSPANPAIFVDGDRAAFSCDISNLGNDSSQTPTNLLAVISNDGIVDEADQQIGLNSGVPAIPPGSTVTAMVSGSPILTSAQSTNFCVMIDSDSFTLSDQSGDLAETDETNNVQCHPVTVLEPQRDLVVVPASVAVSPDPQDPNGDFRAGLAMTVSYQALNQGSGAIRSGYRNSVRLGATVAAALASPASIICGANVSGPSLPMLQGGSITQSYGLGTGASTDLCKIPFTTAPGSHVVVIDLDSDHQIVEVDAGGNPGPAESNNTLVVPITVLPPRPAEFRISDGSGGTSDQRIEVNGPGVRNLRLSVGSSVDLAAWSLRVSWSPPWLISVGDPSLPGGDPGQVAFSTFLESSGRVQSCGVVAIDPVAGAVDLSCQTSDPGSGTPGATNEGLATIATVTFTAVLPGQGTLTLSSLSAGDSQGTQITGLRTKNATFIVQGQPSLFVQDVSPPPAIYPGREFQAGFDIWNDGFGIANAPIRVDLVVSEDGFNDPADQLSPDLLACQSNENHPLPGKTSISREFGSCLLTENLRPGSYTAFFQLNPLQDPATRSIVPVAVSPRVMTLRTTSNGRVAEATEAPAGPGGSVGEVFARARKFHAHSFAVVGSETRNRNWMVRVLRRESGRRRLQLQDLPLGPRENPNVLREVRIGKEDKRALGSADIDGDGDQELIILQREKRLGDLLDFRRIDYGQVWPEICHSAAVTPPLGGRIVAAAGIQIDPDPEDEIAVVTRSGELTIYDLTMNGVPPPASPCNGTPTIFIVPAEALLTPLAADTGFGGGTERVSSICTLDFGLDGVEEIGSLHSDGSGPQSLRIWEPPATMGGSAILVADDPDFGRSGARGLVESISCTR